MEQILPPHVDLRMSVNTKMEHRTLAWVLVIIERAWFLIVRCQCTTKPTQVRWAHSVSHTRVTVERSIKFGIDQNRDAAANCWRLAPWLMPAARRRHPRFFGHFWPSVSPSSRSNFDLGPSPLDSTEKNLSYQSLWDPRSLWNTINALTGRMKTRTPPQASVKDLSDFFASVVTDPNRPIQLTEPGTTTAPHRLLDCFQKVEESTVLELLQNIDDRKSAGSDGLPGCSLKNYAKDLMPSVTQLINASLTSSELPTPLKLATVSPIFKNGDPSLATQYRPISLLPLVSKLLEKVVARQLRSYLEEFSIIPKEQFAYRQHHSTEDALVYAINNFLMAKDQGLYTGLVFVDMSKAFDRVEHQTLIN